MRSRCDWYHVFFEIYYVAAGECEHSFVPSTEELPFAVFLFELALEQRPRWILLAQIERSRRVRAQITLPVVGLAPLEQIEQTRLF